MMTTEELDEMENTPLRMYIALKMLRAWNGGSSGFDGNVVMTVNKWIDSGMRGPIQWPDSPFFDEWAKANGLSRIDGRFVGFKVSVQVGNNNP